MITRSILLQPANMWKLPAAPLPSCLILAPWRAFKLLPLYSLFNMPYPSDVDALSTCYSPANRMTGRLARYPCTLLPLLLTLSPPPSPGSLGLPHLVTMKLYTTITVPARLSISPSNLSAVSGVAERLAGVKGQLINGTQFDKSQRLLSSSRVFRAERSTAEINA